MYPEAPLGSTAPDEFELLPEADLDGQEAWVVRYRYLLPSVEGPYPVEQTEWIAKSDHRLLRQETEGADPFGFVGQVVRVFSYPDTSAAKCPSEFEFPDEVLEPLTTPRLEVRWPSVED